jgi:SPP1 gp7 family putative phage head morphogenesis protein
MAQKRNIAAQNRSESPLNRGLSEADKSRDITKGKTGQNGPRKGPAGGYPIHLEAQHERTFARLFDRMADDILRIAKRGLERADRVDSAPPGADSTRLDAPLDELLSMLDDLRAEYGNVISGDLLARTISKNIGLIDDFARQVTANAVTGHLERLSANRPIPGAPSGKGFPVHPVNLLSSTTGLTAETIDTTIARNLALIRDLEGDLHDGAKRILREGLLRGDSTTTIADRLESQLGIERNRARFWARDQASKFFGEVTRIRQQAAGIPGYIWRTMRDGRVRDNHRDLEGTYHDWKNPPAMIRNGRVIRLHPGGDYNCRCWAEAAWGPEEAERRYVDMVGAPPLPTGKMAMPPAGGGATPGWDGPPPWVLPSSSYRDFDSVQRAEEYARGSLVTGEVNIRDLSDMRTVNLVIRALHDFVVDRGMPKIGGVITRDFRSLDAYAYAEKGQIIFPTAGWNGSFVRSMLLAKKSQRDAQGLSPAVAYLSHYDIVFHEYGHILFDRLSDSSILEINLLIERAFHAEWRSEARRISEYATQSEEDCFSEAFLMYFKDSSLLSLSLRTLIEEALRRKL